MAGVETANIAISAITTLNDIVSPALAETIQNYAEWYKIQAACNIAAILCMYILAGFLIKNYKKIFKKVSDNEDDIPCILFVTGIIFSVIFGVFLMFSPFILANEIPTFFQPKAYAIYQLISEVKGR